METACIIHTQCLRNWVSGWYSKNLWNTTSSFQSSTYTCCLTFWPWHVCWLHCVPGMRLLHYFCEYRVGHISWTCGQASCILMLHWLVWSGDVWPNMQKAFPFSDYSQVEFNGLCCFWEHEIPKCSVGIRIFASVIKIHFLSH